MFNSNKYEQIDRQKGFIYFNLFYVDVICSVGSLGRDLNIPLSPKKAAKNRYNLMEAMSLTVSICLSLLFSTFLSVYSSSCLSIYLSLPVYPSFSQAISVTLSNCVLSLRYSHKIQENTSLQTTNLQYYQSIDHKPTVLLVHRPQTYSTTSPQTTNLQYY